MARIVVTEHVTLDGVMQAPGRADEDTRGGFGQGGWAVSRMDEVIFRVMGEGMASTGALLFGRRTYEDFAGFWPRQPDNPYTDTLNQTQKYVVSHTLSEPLPWQNSTLLAGDIADEVATLKDTLAGTLAVLGSGELVTYLARHNLVDEYVLLIHPVVLGTGRRLLEGGGPAEFSRGDVTPTPSGVIIARYRAKTA